MKPQTKRNSGLIAVMFLGAAGFFFAKQDAPKYQSQVTYTDVFGVEAVDTFGPFIKEECEANIPTYVENIRIDGGVVEQSRCVEIAE